MIEFRNVSLCLNGRMILNEISFRLSVGESVLLLGNSGAGKSTILKLTLGLMQPTGGQILVFGKDIRTLPRKELMAMRRRFGMVFQEGALFDSLSVAENVGFFLKEHFSLTEEEIERRVFQTTRDLGIDQFLDYYPSNISGGMKKRVAIARAIISKPSALLYDEPTAGLDPFSACRVVELIEELQKKFQATSLIVSHEIHYFTEVVDRFIMLKDSEIAYDGAPFSEISRHYEENYQPAMCETVVA